MICLKLNNLKWNNYGQSEINRGIAVFSLISMPQRSHTNIRFSPFVGASKEVTYLPVVR